MGLPMSMRLVSTLCLFVPVSFLLRRSEKALPILAQTSGIEAALAATRLLNVTLPNPTKLMAATGYMTWLPPTPLNTLAVTHNNRHKKSRVSDAAFLFYVAGLTPETEVCPDTHHSRVGQAKNEAIRWRGWRETLSV